MDIVNKTISESIANVFWVEGNKKTNSSLEQDKCKDLFYAVMSNKDLAIVEINENGQFKNIYKIVASDNYVMNCIDPSGIKVDFYLYKSLVPIFDKEKNATIGKRLGIMLKKDADNILKGKKVSNTALTYDIAVIKNR